MVVCFIILLSVLVVLSVLIARRNVGRIARTNVFGVMLRVVMMDDDDDG